MKVLVIQSGSGDATWSHTIKLEQGVQSFTLDYKGTLQEAQWYADQFQHALDAHTAEAIAEVTPGNEPLPVQTEGESTAAPTQPADTKPDGADATTIEAPSVPSAQ